MVRAAAHFECTCEPAAEGSAFADTPYMNGVFLFDIFLPPTYPQVSPNVILLTTGGGSMRFNPNL
jgi:ubiquitin-protein ligase